MMSEREALLRRLSSAKFAAWELHMYLDTHPGDAMAAAKYEEYSMKAKKMTADYESEFGPLTIGGPAGNVEWLSNPWPWENEKEEAN